MPSSMRLLLMLQKPEVRLPQFQLIQLRLLYSNRLQRQEKLSLVMSLRLLRSKLTLQLNQGLPLQAKLLPVCAITRQP